MASSSVLQPEAAAAVWPRFLPSPRRGAAQTYQVLSTNKFERKRPFSGRYQHSLQFTEFAAGSHRSRNPFVYRTSGFSEKAVTSSKPAAVSTSHSDQSSKHLFDSVPDAHTVISGYWIGPDMDDGCGNVVAILQRIV